MQDRNYTTTLLVKNVHCASCVSRIQEVLAGVHPKLVKVEVNVLSQEVRVLHSPKFGAIDVCVALIDAAFEVYSATTVDESGNSIRELEFDDSERDWVAVATDSWKGSSTNERLRLRNKAKCSVHIKNCEACQRDEATFKDGAISADDKLKDVELGDISLSSRDMLSQEVAEENDPNSPSSHDIDTDVVSGSELETSNPESARYEALLSIGGMTCASCTSAIDQGLSELSYVESVNVILMTNSATVTFTGHQNLQHILDAVEDLGYDCTTERCSLVEPSVPSNGVEKRAEQRSVTLKIDGMFCKHCPPRIIETLKSKFLDSVTIGRAPTLKEPLITFTYVPYLPDFTVRSIMAAVLSVNEAFTASVYIPPSIEQRSQAMQKHEQRRLLGRLLFSFVVAIPTLLIGVVWMSLVPASNKIRMFFDQPVWAGAVTRADWALFILATPVMFLAADVFHLRAIKEIRALWRRGSRVPLMRRFYRFGSMNMLISAGTSVAYFSSVAILGINGTTSPQFSGQNSTYFDSVVFLTFFILIGRWLEAYSKAKTGNAVSMLGNLRPEKAILVAQSLKETKSLEEYEQEIENAAPLPRPDTERVDVKLLEIGDEVLVPHGSSPPADGIITLGSTKFNESSLTGEARATAKVEGDTVFAGAVNLGDPIHVKITGVGGSSMLDQIVAVVREGQTRRAPVERVVDIVTGYFVPVITALAIATFVIWLSLGQSGALSTRYLGSSHPGGWAFWSLEFAIAVFVVACPCGIGLAAPTALFVGSGLAAKHGILVRGGGEAFQEASNIDAIVFDKTGTLTEGGDLKVTDHEMLVGDGEIKLSWDITKAMEETSSHPLARALLEIATPLANDQKITALSITEEPGKGLKGNFKTANCSYEAALGSEAFVTSLTPNLTLDYFTDTTLSRWKTQSKSIALLALRKTASDSPPPPWKLATIFAISDPIRPSTIPTLAALQARNIPVYMLTGDNPTTASAVASTLSIPQDHVFAGVLPTEKADKIRWLQKHGPRRSSNPNSSRLSRIFARGPKPQADTRNAIIAFVGDGINDAPALTAANISISPSSATDIAVHSSSFILLSSSLDKIPVLFDLSARVFRRVKFNFAWAVVYNIILVPVAAGCFFSVREGGWRLGPVWGSAAMAMSSLCVVGSSLALRWEGGMKLGRWKK